MVNSQHFIPRNSVIEEIIEYNAEKKDGTIRDENGETIHKLSKDYMYWVYLIDNYGYPNAIGDKGWVFEGQDGDQYVFKYLDWMTNVRYNMLLIPIGLLDRYVFRTKIDMTVDMSES